MEHTNLPLELSSFVGRSADLHRIAVLLETVRLLTVTGPGGIGKTRLAKRAASAALHHYPDGVWLADLAEVADRARVGCLVAEALEPLGVQPRALDTLARQLIDREILLVLDNCERGLAACAELTRSLLESCAGVRIIATSREVLGVAGEAIVTVPPLSLPTAHEHSERRLRQSDAACLFVERLAAALPGFRLRTCDVPRVAEICNYLEGGPLALEVAATRGRTLGLADLVLLARDRDSVLNAPARGAGSGASRHGSLRASFDWSFEPLGEVERMLLRRLAQLSSSWTLGEAQSACVDRGMAPWLVADTLDGLIAKSLVNVKRDGSAVRYSMSALFRHYIEQKLEPMDGKQSAHLTPRELEVLSMLARGYSNKQIGSALAIADGTARVHVEHILSKLDLRSRTQAAVWALRADRAR